MSDEQSTTTEPTPAPAYATLTPRQRTTVYLLAKLGNDMSTGTVEERHTAALLRLCADAVGCGREGALVAMVQHWVLNRADVGDGGSWVAQWETWNSEAGE